MYNKDYKKNELRNSDKDFLSKCKGYAINCHKSTNHRYAGELMYHYHLQSADDVFYQFYSGYFPPVNEGIIRGAIWCHDVIEDARQTFNDVVKNTSLPVAELVYAVTNEKGKNRKERANLKYYQGILDAGEHAIIVKLCDRIANVRHGVENSSSMVKMYRDEHSHFKRMLYQDDSVCQPLWDELERLLFVQPPKPLIA